MNDATLPLGDRILSLLAQQSGLTDREITDQLLGPGSEQQAVNGRCNALMKKGRLERRKRPDGLTGNYLPGTSIQAKQSPPEGTAPGKPAKSTAAQMPEDEVKRHVELWLSRDGWQVKVQWGKAPGIDIEATRGSERWVIEAKGCGSLQPMRVNYFIGILGETLQRMDDPAARYSIALPDLPQYRGLWQRLPRLAKTRTGISILFAGSDGKIAHLE